MDDGGGEHVDVVGLVLAQIGGSERAEVAAHVLACAECRGEYDELAATMSDLLPGVPAVQPPLGFDQRTLERLGVATPSPRRTVPRWRWLATAAAIVIVLVGGAVVAVRSAGEDRPVAIGAVRPLELADGLSRVGTVSIAPGDVDRATVMVVAIVAAPEGVSYRCRTLLTDGTVIESDAWPPGNGAWIVSVPRPASEIDAVELVVDGTDSVWSSASFSDPAE